MKRIFSLWIMEPHGKAPAYYRLAGYQSKRSFGANIPHQRTNSPTGKPVVLLVLGQRSGEREGFLRRAASRSIAAINP